MSRGFPGALEGEDARSLAVVINRMNLGKLNCTGTVTLRPHEINTQVMDSRATADSYIGLTPLTASAAAEMAGGLLHISARANGSFELTHLESPADDRRFVYLLIG